MTNIITFHTMTSIKEEGVITINSWSESEIDGYQNIIGKLTVECIRTKDEAIRDGLIALGWTPPEEKQ